MKKKLLLITVMLILVSTLVFVLCSCSESSGGGKVDNCNHSYVEIATEYNIKTPATCTSPAVYYKVCEKCKKFSTDTFVNGDVKEHTYENDVCSSCGKIKDEVYNGAAKTKGYVVKGDYVYFGSYPQSRVYNQSLIDSLNTSAGQLPTYSSSAYWQPYGYTETGKTSYYMWYRDIDLVGEKYRGVYFVSYRPENSTNDNTVAYSYQDENGYYSNNIYWFKFEPIKWKILTLDNGEALIVSSLVIDSQSFDSDTNSITDGDKRIYASNYEYSFIREWLNALFYETSFSQTQKELIVPQLLDNKTTSEDVENSYASEQNNTTDKVFLLTFKDLNNVSYNLSNSTMRLKQASDYSKVMGIYSGTTNNLNCVKWWTRSANMMSGYQVYYVNYDGNISTNNVDSTQIGILPALKIRICTSDNPQGHDFVEKVGEGFLKTSATCTESAIYYKSCSVCGAKSDDTFTSGDPLGHSIVEDPSDDCLKSPSSCTSKAVFYKSCSRCHEKFEETFEYGDILEHEMEYKTVDPTCEEEGYTARVCSVCGYMEKEKMVSPLGHSIISEQKSEYLCSAATCTEPAVYYKHCTKCGKIFKDKEEDKFIGESALGHNYAKIVDSKNLKTEATCTEPAIYYLSCKRCGEKSNETFASETAAGHSYKATLVPPTCIEQGYTKMTCTRCGNSYNTDYVNATGHKYVNNICSECKKVNIEGNYLKIGEYVYFGSYPQTQITSETLIARLNKKAGVLPTANDSQEWNSYNYYFNGKNNMPHMWYIDITIDEYGEQYRGVYFDEYRTYDTESVLTEDSYYNQIESGFIKNKTYWFRYDAIKWRILTMEDGNAFLFSSLVLDSQNFNNTSSSTTKNENANDWKTSSIRSWLNSTFYKTAFSASEKGIIVETNNTTYNSFKTEYSTADNVFLISIEDLKNKDYGFGDITDSADSNKNLSASAYAFSQGLDLEGLYSWLTRSAKENDISAKEVQMYGIISGQGAANAIITTLGVAPLVKIKLTECISAHDYIGYEYAPSCTKEGYTLYVCRNCGNSYKGNIEPALGHDYIDGICKQCESIDIDTIKALYETQGYAKNNSTVYFGLYPQSIFTNESIINALFAKVGNPTKGTISDKWIAYAYYSEGKNTDLYMWYTDVSLGAQKYRGVYLKGYRPNDYNDPNTDTYSSVGQNGYKTDQVYWFTYDPIEWLMSYEDGNVAQIIAMLALDAQPFFYGDATYEINNETYYANNWEKSFIRNWLNDTFYETAFSSLQKELIEYQVSYVKTTSQGGESNKYATRQKNTTDKVTIPSYSFYVNELKEYYSDSSLPQWLRQSETTAYAKIQGLYVESGGEFDANCNNITRSASKDSETSVLAVSVDGSIYDYSYYELSGIIPQIKISISTCYFGDTHEYLDGICVHCGHVDKTLFNNAIKTKGYATNNMSLYYGMTPQSQVLDPDIIEELNEDVTKQDGTADIEAAGSKWLSSEYYYDGNKNTKYSWVIEKEYGGNYYRGVYFTHLRQKYDHSSASYSSIDVSDYEIETVYWFKYEPIKWKILNIQDGNYTLISNSILDSMNFNNKASGDIKPSAFDNSLIYKALNDQFLDWNYKNFNISTDFIKEPVKLASKDDLTNIKYSYQNSNVQDPIRKIKYTDYAAVRCLQTGGYESSYGNWLTSTAYDDNSVYYVDYYGQIKSAANVLDTSFGIVPMITFYCCADGKHTYEQRPMEEYLVKDGEATCSHASTYYTSCSKCDKSSQGTQEEQTFTSGGVLPHTYKLTCNGTAKCEVCNKEESFYQVDREYIYFGSYPQSEVTDSTLKTSLDALAGTPSSPATNAKWTAYGYYKNSNNSTAYMWYIDVTQTDANTSVVEKYRGVYFAEYRPKSTTLDSTQANSYQYINGYDINQTYWFKYEPIKWRVSFENDGIATLIADIVLDAQPYQNTYKENNSDYYNNSIGTIKDTFSNDYAYSTIRQWLKDSFYEIAFDKKDLIELSKYNYASNYTIDYVALPSTSEFNSIFKYSSNLIISQYAQAQGAQVNTISEVKYSDWWTRDINTTVNAITNPNITNSVKTANSDSTSIVTSIMGIVPIIKLRVCMDHNFEQVDVVDPTCKEKGYTVYKCKNCSYTYYDNFVQAKGHSGGVATCSSPGVCKDCGTEYVPQLSHDYKNGVCIYCHNIDMDKVKETMRNQGFAYYKENDFEKLYFGYYPQSEVTDPTLKTSLNTLAGTPSSPAQDVSWTSYGYYISDNSTAYMWYIDVIKDGEKYRGVYFAKYRPSSTKNDSSEANSYQDDNKYYTGTTYWFKYEPILWNVLYTNAKEKLIQCSIIIDSQAYQNHYEKTGSEYVVSESQPNTYASYWSDSTIRKWLQETFYNTAFNADSTFYKVGITTSLLQGYIKTVTNDNKKTTLAPTDGNPYASYQVNTEDKIFELAYSELSNEKYGFIEDYYTPDANRRKQVTDYAKAQGIQTIEDNNVEYGSYWTRSAYYEDSRKVTIVSPYGIVESNSVADVTSTSTGVVPIMWINLCGEDGKECHTYDEVISSTALRSQATCEKAAEYYYTCRICGTISKTQDMYFVNGKPLQHDYKEIITKEPTCVLKGSHYYECLICKHKTEVTDIEPTGHKGGKATCSQQAICDVCHEPYGETSDHKLVFSYKVDPSCENGYTVYVCSICKATVIVDYVAGAGHSGGSANCSHKAICNICHKEYGEIDENNHEWKETTQVATCRENGFTYYRCSICGMYKNSSGEAQEEFVYYSETTKIHHDWDTDDPQPSNAYLKSAQTCTSPAVYYNKCKVCGEKSTRFYEYGIARGHEYVKETCRQCGDKLILRVDENGNATAQGQYILFGTYPQTRVSNDELIALLNQTIGFNGSNHNTVFPVTNDATNTSYNYSNVTGVNADMRYKDVWYLGTQYRAVYIKEYRNSVTPSVQAVNGYTKGNVYWFKFEKIKWKILSQSNGEALVYAVLSIDAQEFNCKETTNTTAEPPKYANDWAMSTIRAWLNDTFYNTAFTSLQKSLIIQNNSINNSITAEGIKDDGTQGNVDAQSKANTQDTIFLLSYADIFSSGYSIDNIKTTDYADCQGSVLDQNKLAYWWTRSPNYVTEVSYANILVLNGKSKTSSAASELANVVPAMRIKLCFEHNYVDGVCAKCGDTLYEIKTDSDNNRIVIFGSYPQTRADSSIELILNNICSKPTASDYQGWTKFNYYFNSVSSVYMWYKDVELFGSKYRGVCFSNYRTIRTDSDEQTTATSYLDDNGFETNTIYWFKYEPIEWMIVSQDGGEALLVSKLVLDSQNFGLSDSSWALSTIRSWLNDEISNDLESFLETAFLPNEKTLILNQVLDNRLTAKDAENNSSSLNQQNTIDKVSLFSYQDLENDDIKKFFGNKFSSSSQYANIQGLKKVDADVNTMEILLRSSVDANNILYWDNARIEAKSSSINVTSYGIRPVIKLQLCSHDYYYEAGTMICKKCRNVIYKNINTSINPTMWQGNAVDTIEMGMYPTELLGESENSIKTVLGKLIGELPTPSNSYGWTSYKYYSGGYNTSDYMWYLDIEYGGTKYRGVYFTNYRPTGVTKDAGANNSYVDDNGYVNNTIYWFKYTTLQWINIYTDTNGEKTYVSKLLLDSQLYSRSNDGTWDDSQIKLWLNNTFANIAFSKDEIDILSDGVTLLSESEIKLFKEESLCMNPTDYAKVQGVKMDTIKGSGTYGLAYWITRYRDPNNSSRIQTIKYNIAEFGETSYISSGIVPVIKIKI